MSLRIPSLQKQYNTHFSGDPAFVQCPPDADDATKAQHADRVRVARETGDWSALVVPGRAPTTFVMRQVPRDIVFALRDAMRATERNGIVIPPKLGRDMSFAWWFRAGLRRVENFDDGEAMKVDLVDSPIYGSGFASDEVLQLDAVAPGLVLELGLEVFQRASDIAPKS